MDRPFLTADWRHLAMLNYEVDPVLLRPFTPVGVELDSWNGRFYASMVAFLFLDTRVRGVSIPFHRNFEEINLRFYVRRRGPEGWRRGVVFIKEIVPRVAIATVARLFYNENYVALPTSHSLEQKNDGWRAEYRWRLQGRWCHLRLETAGAPFLPGSESLEEYVTEHYWGYAAQRKGGCVEYQVGHPQWRVWRAQNAQLDCDVATLYGPAFAGCLGVPPASAFLAEGSPVSVSRGVRQ